MTVTKSAQAESTGTSTNKPAKNDSFTTTDPVIGWYSLGADAKIQKKRVFKKRAR